jgi:hypothetical protein
VEKRRNTIGKKGKHGREDFEIPVEKVAERRKKKIMIVAVVVILAIIIASLFFFFIMLQQEDEEKDVLTADTPHNEGFPNEEIIYEFTVYNPSKESDVFSPLVSGLPSDWVVSLPSPISLEGKKLKHEEFSITPSSTALNKTYSFLLNITSGNTQQTYTVKYSLTIYFTSYGVELLCYNNSHDADPGRSTYYAIMVKNTGNQLDKITLSYKESHLPNNWSISFDINAINVTGLGTEVIICNITTHSNTPKGRYDIDIIATSSSGKNASIRVNTSLVKDFKEKMLEIGDKDQVNYIGILTDGMIFDTSYFEVANNSDYPKTEDFTMRSFYEPLKMFVGDTDPDPSDDYGGMIEGFWEGVIGMKMNETKVVRIPPEKAYTRPGYESHALYGKTLIFEITVVSIDN